MDFSKIDSPHAIVEYYVATFHEGLCDDAFHCLIEEDVAIIPALISAYEASDDIEIKAFLVDVVSEFRLPSFFGFLSHALRRQEPQIWKKALNGLAMVESAEAIELMGHVISSIRDEEKIEWIEEAISDSKLALAIRKNN